MRETLTKLLGREPTLEECRAWLALQQAREQHPIIEQWLKLPTPTK